MTDPQQYQRSDDTELAALARRAQAIRDAIEHVGSAVGVLDTMPESRDLAPIPEKARTALQAKLTP